jgi:drug/metabolite transporter (DMT)-like permease
VIIRRLPIWSNTCSKHTAWRSAGRALVQSADGFLAYAVTRGDLAVVAVLASLAPLVTALLAHALTAERPSGPQAAGAALAVLGTLVVSAAQAAG